jgi:hypothetical protein
MNFLIDFIYWVFPISIHKVDLFLAVFPILVIASFVSLSEFGFKQAFSIVGYTMILNFIAILLGFQPHFWWAWGWTFAFIPVFNWWKPMMLIFSVSIVLMVIAYNNGYDKEMDKYSMVGFSLQDSRCLNWPCTEFSEYYSYTMRAQAKKEKEAAAKAAKAATRARPAPGAPAPQEKPGGGMPLTPPLEMYQPR